MSDDLVKQFVEHLRFGGVGVQVRADSCAPLADAIDALTAERDRLREALNQCRLAFAGYVSVQSAIDLIDRAALKGETP